MIREPKVQKLLAELKKVVNEAVQKSEEFDDLNVQEKVHLP
jgi:hypothetical protein